ncbi:MAG: heparinase II/III family protein [Actinomycetota bacterium]|nr:heparinase II/III family protein [Actinomycetota bacterium]MDQ6945034.1 heparinase II/III family protein [Actinomycetota bacterium]
MSAAEMAWRLRDQARHLLWRRRQVGGDARRRPAPPAVLSRTPPKPLPAEARSVLQTPAGQALRDAAEELLAGRWEFLGVARDDLVAPDWFLDPISGRQAPADTYAFRIDPRSEEETGNVKQVWELSRHHHLTVLSAAYFMTGDDRYADVVGRQLCSWWQQNPFLSGINWTSGIELGIRLISWTWVRRLLDGWSGVAALFEDNESAVQQLFWHQQYLAAFVSRGSSANNHVIAEAAGQLCASSAFAWFPESLRWRQQSADRLERELANNTFASGINRELASEYHCFVAELGLVASLEAAVAGHPLSRATTARLCQMVDAAAAIVDERLVGPRQGDGDDGRALVLDRPDASRWEALLALGASRYGALDWWPALPKEDVRSTLFSALATLAAPPSPETTVVARPNRRRSHFGDAGITLLRTTKNEGPEIWCRCDGGPHGYLSIAAHGHADALSVELRHGGIDIFADPGTYCYHGEAKWRAYFRSTVAHNTLELGGRDQSTSGGPFLWVRTASVTDVQVAVDTDDGVESWSAEHDGYRTLDPPAIHGRTVHLDRNRRVLSITDRVSSDVPRPCRLAFHLGPSVIAALEGDVATLQWPRENGSATATVRLPAGLDWQLHRGEDDPVMGWYSRSFGRKQPAFTLLGRGAAGSSDQDLVTVVEFSP